MTPNDPQKKLCAELGGWSELERRRWETIEEGVRLPLPLCPPTQMTPQAHPQLTPLHM